MKSSINKKCNICHVTIFHMYVRFGDDCNSEYNVKKKFKKKEKNRYRRRFFHENIFPHPFLTSIHLIHLYVCHSFIISTCSKVKNFQARLGVSTKRKALIAQTRYNKDYPLKPPKKTCKISLSFHEKKNTFYSILNPITSL